MGEMGGKGETGGKRGKKQRQKGLLTRMNTDRLRIKADEGMSACARHCDRSCNGIHTLAASQGTGCAGGDVSPSFTIFPATSVARGGGSDSFAGGGGDVSPGNR